MNKKGVLEQLGGLVVPIIGIAIVLVVGFLIFAEAKTQVVGMDGTAAVTTTDETITFANNTLTALAIQGDCMTLSCSVVENATTVGGLALDGSCYACGITGITVQNGTGVCVTNTNVNVTYSCQAKTAAYNATGTLQNTTQTIPGWLPIIVITIIGALLIGLVTRFRANR